MRKGKRIEVPLTPGARSDDTDLAVKLQAVDMDKARFRGNRCETIKGWEQFVADGMSAGVVRGAHSWTMLDGTPVLLACSNNAVNAWINGTRQIITPKWADIFIDRSGISDNEFTWLVYDPATGTSVEAPHFLQVGDTITMSGVPYHGAAPNPNGTFTIDTIVSPSKFTTSVTPNPGTAENLDAYRLVVNFRNGLATGTGDTAETRTRIYSVSNYGEVAVFCGSDGTPVFFWQPTASRPELVTDGTMDTLGSPALSSTWITEGAWSVGSGTAVHTGTASDLTQDISGALEGGKTYEMSFTLSGAGTSCSLTVKVDTIVIHPPIVDDGGGNHADLNRTWTFTFVCPANPTYLVFLADGTLTLDNVTIKEPVLAQPISQAPSKNYALFVDSNHILHVLGSVEADGDFNPLLLRWCDQDNLREWIPDTDNVAGELILGVGSYAVCGAQVGERNLIITDDAAFTASFTAFGYSLFLAGQGCGAIGNRALAVHNNRAMWAGMNGFYGYDGAQVSNIECPVKDRYVKALAEFQENKTYVWDNVEYGEAWIHFAHMDDGTEISRYLTFAYGSEGQPWALGTFDRPCIIRPSVFHDPIGFDTAGNVWRHEIGTDMPNEALPFLETGYLTAGAGDRWIGLRRYFPDIEAQEGNILYTPIGKRAPQGQNNIESRGPFVVIPNQATVDFRISAGQLKQRWESQDTPTRWRLGIVGVEVVSERERR